MHGWGTPARVLLVPAAFVLTGCMGLIAKKHTYSATSPPVTVNGAEIRMQVRPEGTAGGSYAVTAMVAGAAVATFDGPFRWRLEATGRPGVHEAMVVHRIHTRTGKTRRDEWYPREHLGQRAEFLRAADSREFPRAVYQVPGLLMVKPREDGPLEVTVDLSIRAATRTERRTVRFRMNPAEERQDEFVFLPAEIVRSFNEPPESSEDARWD